MINNITRYKAFILAIGMIAGLGIVAQPVLKAYVDYEQICQLELGAESNQKSDSDEQKPNIDQISALEAVAPTAQIHLSPLDFVSDNQPIAETHETSTLEKMAVCLPEKLLKVLFNIIIAPNAP